MCKWYYYIIRQLKIKYFSWRKIDFCIEYFNRLKVIRKDRITIQDEAPII